MSTQDELKDLLNELKDDIDELNAYRSIGTIEEFKAMKNTYTNILKVTDNT